LPSNSSIFHDLEPSFAVLLFVIFAQKKLVAPNRTCATAPSPAAIRRWIPTVGMMRFMLASRIRRARAYVGRYL
jgi:hypothetical protein